MFTPCPPPCSALAPQCLRESDSLQRQVRSHQGYTLTSSYCLPGVTDKLELETANKPFLDAVLAAPIAGGEGETNTTIFVDSNHTKVSYQATGQVNIHNDCAH